jgi:hypothetical protein
VEQDVWQKLSWRSSSIQWQLANETMTFVLQTIRRMGESDNSVLKYLLEEAAANHWCGSVRERAKAVLGMLPEG